MTAGDTYSPGREQLDRLEEGDRFRVDCHDKTLRVHSTGPFGGIIILDAYDEDGGHWPVGEVDDQLYLGWSQLSPPERQTRAKKIDSVEIVGQRTEQATLVPDGGTENPDSDRYDESHNLRYGVVQDEIEMGYSPDKTTVTITQFDDEYHLSMTTRYGQDATILFHRVTYHGNSLWFEKDVGDRTVTTGSLNWHLLDAGHYFGLVGEWFRDQIDLDEYRTGAKCPECGSEILNDEMYSGCENLDCDVFFEGVPDDSWEPYNTGRDQSGGGA